MNWVPLGTSPISTESECKFDIWWVHVLKHSFLSNFGFWYFIISMIARGLFQKLDVLLLKELLLFNSFNNGICEWSWKPVSCFAFNLIIRYAIWETKNGSSLGILFFAYLLEIPYSINNQRSRKIHENWPWISCMNQLLNSGILNPDFRFNHVKILFDWFLGILKQLFPYGRKSHPKILNLWNNRNAIQIIEFLNRLWTFKDLWFSFVEVKIKLSKVSFAWLYNRV